MPYIEYRLRPVTRYVVTRYERDDRDVPVPSVGHSSTKGEFDNEETAYAVAYALAREEHERLGFPVGDERIRYPKPLNASRMDEAGAANDAARAIQKAPQRQP